MTCSGPRTPIHAASDVKRVHAGELNEVIAPSCYSCFDYTNSLADMVRGAAMRTVRKRIHMENEPTVVQPCDMTASRLQVVGYMGVPYENTDMTSHPQASPITFKPSSHIST